MVKFYVHAWSQAIEHDSTVTDCLIYKFAAGMYWREINYIIR
jgi:hypothetical protein